MKYRIFVVFVLSAFVLNLGASTFADTRSKKASANQLALLLPASDGVVTLDGKRFFSDALPRLLSSNQPMLDRITGEMNKFQEKTGIDVRQFESIAAGANARRISDKNYELEPVVIARGQTSSAALIGAAKLAAKAKYSEEHFGERTIYVFTGTDLGGKQAANKFPGVVAVTTIDPNTIAFGTLDRVRAALEGRTKVGADLMSLLDRNQTSVVNFATKMPTGMKSFVPLDNDELGKNIDSIQYVYGNADVGADSASIHMTARTLQNAQAASLLETLEGLQLIGKAFLGGAKDPDKRAFARMIENVKFSVRANEVTFDLQIPQADIDIIVGKMK